MTVPPPPWIAPSLRLVEADVELGWVEIAERAAALESDMRAADRRARGKPVAVTGDRASTVLAALVAAERAGVALFLRRHAAGGDEEVAVGGGFAVLLETSGTTGAPKRVRHDFQRLRGRLRGTADPSARWLLTYEPAAFAGLQVILTAAAAGATLVSAPGGGAAELAAAAVRHGVTHVSGTPSFWRAFLLALGGVALSLRAVTLGGEAADQPLLDRLAAAFPDATRRHIYASTEAGALFAVSDGRAGFPAAWLDEGAADSALDGVGLRIRDAILEVRSPRAMLGYGGADKAADGWLSTGDLVERRGDRVFFNGRLDGRVNVGGVKVAPEVVEHLLLDLRQVADALVRAAPNPITGHILIADLVPAPGVTEAELRAAVREAVTLLPPAARPRVLSVVDAIPLGAAGKKTRGGAA